MSGEVIINIPEGRHLIGLRRFKRLLGQINQRNDLNEDMLDDLETATWEVEQFCNRLFVPTPASTRVYPIPSSSILIIDEFLADPAPVVSLLDAAGDATPLSTPDDYRPVFNERGKAYYELIRRSDGVDVEWRQSGMVAIRVVGTLGYDSEPPALAESLTATRALRLYISRAHGGSNMAGGASDVDTNAPGNLDEDLANRALPICRESVAQTVAVGTNG